jgi:hypothetical protein
LRTIPSEPGWEDKTIDLSSLHPSALALFSYWQGIHPVGGLPGRQHFEPSCIVRLLANIVLVEVHRSPFRFRYRLLGTRVDAAHGKPLTGLWLDQAYGDHPEADKVLEEYRLVAESRKPLWRRSQPTVVPEPECRTIEVLRLPLATDGEVVDMILGLTLYFDSGGRPVETIAYRRLGYAGAESA